MNGRNLLRSAALACAALMSCAGASHAQGVDQVKVGVNKAISDLVFYIAQERGFFAEQKARRRVDPL